MTNFKKGDIVRLKTGNADILVTSVSGRSLKGSYVLCGMGVSWRADGYFELVTAAKEQPKVSSADPYTQRHKYRSKATGREVPYIGMTTENMLVLQATNVCAFTTDPNDWEKVVPFTFQVKWTSNGAYSAFAGTQGDVALRDRLVDSEGYECMVTGINVQSNVTTRFVGKRYVLEDLR